MDAPTAIAAVVGFVLVLAIAGLAAAVAATRKHEANEAAGAAAVAAALAAVVDARRRRAARCAELANVPVTALITGANSGLGFGLADALAGAGVRVICGCRSAERGAAAVAKLRKRHPAADVRLLIVDVADAESVIAAVGALTQTDLYLPAITLPAPREATAASAADATLEQGGVPRRSTLAPAEFAATPTAASALRRRAAITQRRLDLLFLNAGVMPVAGQSWWVPVVAFLGCSMGRFFETGRCTPRSPHFLVQPPDTAGYAGCASLLGTNVVGHYLLARLLEPWLAEAGDLAAAEALAATPASAGGLSSPTGAGSTGVSRRRVADEGAAKRTAAAAAPDSAGDDADGRIVWTGSRAACDGEGKCHDCKRRGSADRSRHATASRAARSLCQLGGIGGGLPRRRLAP